MTEIDRINYLSIALRLVGLIFLVGSTPHRYLAVRLVVALGTVAALPADDSWHLRDAGCLSVGR